MNEIIKNSKKCFGVALLLIGLSLRCYSQSNDETSIKAVIEKETQSFNRGDAEAVISCWRNVPYAYSLVHYGTGVWYQTNENLDLPAKYRTMMKGGGGDSIFTNTHYVIHINQNAAFVISSK